MFKIVNEISELPDFEGPVFCDIETDGLYTNVRMIQFFSPQVNQVYILDLAPIGYSKIKYIGALENLRNYLKTIHSVWYNASYDLGTLNISPHKFDDLYYAMKMAYPEFGIDGFGLKKVVKKLRYTEGLYDSTQEGHGKKGYPKGSYVSQSQLRYAATDVIALEKMWNDPKMRNVIQNNKAYALDIQSLKYSLVYQQNGLLLNRDMWEVMLEESKRDDKKYTAMLPVGFNPRSYIQVRRFLGIEQSDHEALVEYSLSNKHNAEDADIIIKAKRAYKEYKYLLSINFNNMTTKFNPGGAVSGRFTASGGDLPNGFNSQQIPRKFQPLFNSPTENTVVIDADYSTLELRLAAALFGDKSMYTQLKEGKDLHTDMVLQTNPGKYLHPDKGVIKVTGTDIDTGKWVTSEDRIKAKAVNFGFVFGMSANTFIPYARTSYGLIYTKSEAESVRRSYFNKYRDIAIHHKWIWNHYKDKGFLVYTAMGRPIKPRLGTDAINGPVQGTGAETTKLAVMKLVEKDPEALKYIYNVVHDSIYMRVPRGREKYWSPILEESMLEAWQEMCTLDAFKYKDIPMIAEVEVND